MTILDRFKTGGKKITNTIKSMYDGDIDTIKEVVLKKKKKKRKMKLNSQGLLKDVLKYRRRQEEVK